MESFNIRMLRLAVWSVFLLLAVEYHYTASSPDNQSSDPILPTDGGAIKTTIATIHPTFSTPGPPSGHTSTFLPAKTQGPNITTTTPNSTEPPPTKTLFSTSSKDILSLPPPTTPGEPSTTGAHSTNGTRITLQPPTTPGEPSTTGAHSTNGTRTTIPPSTTPGEPSTTGAHSTNGTRTTIPPSTTPGEPSTTGAHSTNGTRRNATLSIIPPLSINSSPTTTVKSTATPVPVTKQPCPTPSSTTNRTAPLRPGDLECPRSPSGVASQCLVVIALLAALLTVFVVSTVVLCTKLSRRYRLDRQHGTEMVCLSSMMIGHNHTNGRTDANLEGHRTLLTGPEDSDEDSGDNLTLNSFLPDGDRMV